MFTVSPLSLQNVCYYDSVYVLSFRSRINPDQTMTMMMMMMMKMMAMTMKLTMMWLYGDDDDDSNDENDNENNMRNDDDDDDPYKKVLVEVNKPSFTTRSKLMMFYPFILLIPSLCVSSKKFQSCPHLFILLSQFLSLTLKSFIFIFHVSKYDLQYFNFLL